MLTYTRGDILMSPAKVIVNTVNTVGVMGKGLARRFKDIYPDMFEEYRTRCLDGRLDIGHLMIWRTPNKWVLNFPTKKHWRNPSTIEYIERGLEEFRKAYSDEKIESIAFPPLGCGHGGLDFDTDVQPLLEKHLSDLPIRIFIYPKGTGPEGMTVIDARVLREWLTRKSCPLTFSDVWRDTREVIKTHGGTFRTPRRGNEFRAMLDDEERSITFHSGKRSYRVRYEELSDLWRQLRVLGYTSRNLAPVDLQSEISYIIPLWKELPYVYLVNISIDYDTLRTANPIGLQYVPYHVNRFNCGSDLTGAK